MTRRQLKQIIKEEILKLNEDKFKGKTIYPSWVKSDEFGYVVNNISKLQKNDIYIILDLGDDSWKTGYKFLGKKGKEFIFKSMETKNETMSFDEEEMKNIIKDKEIYTQL